MTVCAACGRESPEGFAFCGACGAPLAADAQRREVRKVVTVLFCDLAGSTAIGDRTDPEALRALMSRYYEAARAVLERHGGTVEKFVGDAVMAVFGIPAATEDDALRAVRAAVELREAVHELGLEARIGVNTGEVVAGEGDTLVTGDAVNVTARLEQAAAPGEILLGGDTVRLVRDAVATEPRELTLKGKPEPVAAFRLERLDAEAAGLVRRLDRPLVGRVRERERLRADFADAVAARTCRLFTLLGPAGVGKSRLVADFLEHAGDEATIASGRALSYGEGITYWPLVEALLKLGIDPAEAIRSSPADTQLATRALLEGAAEERPLVLVLDDLQWAEPPLLDLVEHVADWSREAPILLLCVARPELLDLRPGWGGGKANATSVLLEPLGDGEATSLADALLDGVELEGGVRERILAVAEGNPLFLEEMAALAREAGGSVDVPPTIQALLQARLDTLTEPERAVIERGSVEGKVFHRGAVAALAPDTAGEDVAGRLLSLVRKELVRPDRTQIPGDDAFRFRHLLIRDTAYESLPKAVRAELHERFAGWLDAHASLVEQDEIVGYHLEQAARYRAELGGEAGAAAIGVRAAARLGAAGVAAFERHDGHAARNLLERAIALLPAGAERSELAVELAEVLIEHGETEAVRQLVVEVEASGERGRANAVALRVLADPIGMASDEEAAARLTEARDVLLERGDLVGAARCERARAWLEWGACRAGETHHAYRRAYELLRRAGRRAWDRDLLQWLQISAGFGGEPVDDVLRLLEEFEQDAADGGPLLAAALGSANARSLYVAGRIDAAAARAAFDREIELLLQTGSELAATDVGHFWSMVLFLEGERERLEAQLRREIATLERLDWHLYLGQFLAHWATALCDLGNGTAALEAVERGRSIAAPEDVADQVALDTAEAYARALLGELPAARGALARASGRARDIDMLVVTDELERVAAHVDRLAGHRDQAAARLRRLADDVEARGLRRFAERYRRDLAALD
jgi:class 3 adenylate cyclase